MKKNGKQKNLLINLIFNIIIPIIILTKFSNKANLGVLNGLLVALMFPFAYGLYDLYLRKKVNMLSILGLISIAFTGLVGLIHLDNQWIVIKEAAVPLVIGISILVILKFRYRTIERMVLNEQVFDKKKIKATLIDNGLEKSFKSLLTKAVILFSCSFFLSSVLNYILAKVIVVSPAGTEAFNEELGQMMGWSFPVIALPSLIIMVITLWYLISGIRKLTGLKTQEIFNAKEK